MSCLHHSSFAIFHYQHFCLSKQANVLTEEQSRKYHASLAGLMTATLLFPLSGRSHRSEFVTLCCHCYQTPTGRRIGHIRVFVFLVQLYGASRGGRPLSSTLLSAAAFSTWRRIAQTSISSSFSWTFPVGVILLRAVWGWASTP